MGNLVCATENVDSKPPVVCMFRHGPRSPCLNAAKAFEGAPAGERWKDQENGALTETGLEQSEVLGKHIATLMHGLTGPSINRVGWYSSIRERALRSGTSFMKGFNTQATAQNPDFDTAYCAEPVIVDNADHVFRPWAQDESYKEHMKALKNGDHAEFNEKAEQEEEILRRLQKHLSPKLADAELPRLLYLTCAAVEVLECEKYWKPDGLPRLSTILVDDLGEEGKEKVMELGRWVWHYRFFTMDAQRSLGDDLLNLMKDVAAGHPYSVFSAHDYSIYVLLNRLGVQGPLDDVLGFSSYLICTFDQESGEITGMRLNSMPFSEVSQNVVVGTETQLSF